MSEFCVELRRISDVKSHNNADSLELAKVNGLENQFVVGKGDMKVGDLVVYFPIDSLIPDKVLEFLPTPIKIKLTGKVPRIKTVKLRGEISQGLAIKANTVPWEDFICDELPIDSELYDTQDVTAILGVTKYEPPVVHDATVDGLALPEHAPYYDIEGCERNKKIVEYLLSDDAPDILIQEKLEGTNLAVVLSPEGNVQVCQRSMAIYPRNPETGKRVETCIWNEIPEYFLGNKYWDGAVKSGLILFARNVQEYTAIVGVPRPCVTVRAELIGPSIQGNWYGLKEQQAWVFEVMLNGMPVCNQLYKDVTALYGKYAAPVLYRGKLKEFLNGKTVAEASTDKSILNSAKLREGIVIRWDNPVKFGQKDWRIIKQRSPEYLAKSEN
jgi:RNA ligase (TIGR02306 family)